MKSPDNNSSITPKEALLIQEGSRFMLTDLNGYVQWLCSFLTLFLFMLKYFYYV